MRRARGKAHQAERGRERSESTTQVESNVQEEEYKEGASHTNMDV